MTVRDVATLLNCSLRTVYYYIESGNIKAVNLGQRITRVKRSEIDKLFDQPYTPPPKREAKPVTEFYTVKEIEERYFVKYGRLNNIIKENDITKTLHDGKLLVSKPHIDRYFKGARKDVSKIT